MKIKYGDNIKLNVMSIGCENGAKGLQMGMTLFNNIHVETLGFDTKAPYVIVALLNNFVFSTATARLQTASVNIMVLHMLL